MLTDEWWLQKEIIWMQTFLAGNITIGGLTIPHEQNNMTAVWREFQSFACILILCCASYEVRLAWAFLLLFGFYCNNPRLKIVENIIIGLAM